MLKPLLFLSLLTLPLACGGSTSTPAGPAGEAPVALQSTIAEIGLDPAAMDKSAEPCTDFFQYACGGWLANNEIPADKSSYGRFSEIIERNEEELKSILEELRAQEGELSPAMTKVRDFYNACMDEEAVEAQGTKPMDALLKSIASMKNPKQRLQVIEELHGYGIWPLFSMESDADFKDATKTILYVDQGGMGLPEKGYYLKDDESMLKIRKAYLEHVGRMFVLAGFKDAAAKAAADDVMAFETSLAEAAKSAEERQDPDAWYNKVDRAGLAKLTPSLDWSVYFKTLGYPDLEGISVVTPKFMERVEEKLNKTPMKAWKNYLTWQVLRAHAPSLGKNWVDEAFKMQAVLTGQLEIRPRWKRCLSATNDSIGELLAQPFVDRKFGGESKQAAVSMITGISSAFAQSLGSLGWMGSTTKAKAEEKRAKMSYLIGYPDKWRSYDFPITADSYATNLRLADGWEVKRQLAKVGKPYDRSEWHMVPQIVNAYYNPVANQMVFPAGILQPPFFSAKASVAVNMGAMGMIVGHELTHGFDNNGAKFDGDGNRSNWWQDADLKQFEGKGECVIKQYESFEPLPGKKINGKLTLGENIADIGGIKMSYRAYKALRADKQPVMAEGLNEDQQFFLAVGQAWCSKSREEQTRLRLDTDSHSPPKFRINGALANQPEFAEAWGCEKGTPMNPANTCEVW